jgi:hypothetical protein
MHTDSVAKPADRNVTKRKQRNKNTRVDAQRYNKCGISNVMIVPVITGATGHSKKIIEENV